MKIDKNVATSEGSMQSIVINILNLNVEGTDDEDYNESKK